MAGFEQAIAQLKAQGQYDSLNKAVEKARYSARYQKRTPLSAEVASLAAPNPAQGFNVNFTADGVSLSSRCAGEDEWRVGLRLTGFGYGDTLPAAHTVPLAAANRVEYDRATLVEWYLNDRRGLEQGFMVQSPPAAGAAWSDSPLVVTMAVEGDLKPRLIEGGQAVQLVNGEGEAVLRYAELKTWDATGRALPARMEVADGQLALLVDDAGAAYPVVIDPLVSSETKLTASDAAENDEFGFSVGISGDTVVIGARGDDDPAVGQNTGSAYVFVRSCTTWSEQAKLTASDAAFSHEFGWSVGISGDTVVVGAHFDDDPVAGENAGSAYVFVRSGTTWSEQAKLTASDAAEGDEFGWSVGISGDTVVIGALNDDLVAGENAGSAYVFVRSGTTWSEQAKLTASDAAAGDGFGRSVAIGGDTVVAGSRSSISNVGNVFGSAYVFVRSGSAWSEQAKLTASDAAEGDEFGSSVGISGETVVVGAPDDDVPAANTGSAYVFVRSGTTWSEQTKLTASDAAEFDQFGWSVGISGDTVVVGAHFDDDPVAGANAGSAYVYEPPLITGASVDQPVLTQPNHKMVDITVNYGVSDNCGAVNCVLSVASNEPENGLGDGDTSPDWEVLDAHHVRVRNERSGGGTGRIYTITITCTDGAGNISSQNVTVTVPHS